MESAGALGAASAMARVRLTANTISAIGTTQLSRMLPGWLPDTDADDARNPATMCEQPMSAIVPAHRRLIWRFLARNTGDCHSAGSTDSRAYCSVNGTVNADMTAARTNAEPPRPKNTSASSSPWSPKTPMSAMTPNRTTPATSMIFQPPPVRTAS